MPRWPAFIGGSNTAQSLIADAERTVNLCVQSTQMRGVLHPAALIPAPGFQAWATVGDVGGRGAVVANGRLFMVIGATLYEFSNTGMPTIRGTVPQDSNPAQLIFNGVVGGQLGICSGGSVFSYDLASNVLSVAILTGGYTHLAFADGYGLAFNPRTGKVNLSNLNDVSIYAAGTFFQRSKFPDPWQTMFVDPNGLIWLIGTETFEVWYDTGAGTQPWAPLSGLFGRFGIAAPFAYGISGGGLYWLARSAEGGVQIVTTKGGVPAPVSTYAVNNTLAGYLRTTSIVDAEMLIYQDRGHTYVNTSFPTAKGTWTFDAEGRNWTERGQWNRVRGAYDAWAPRIHVDCFGMHLVADRTTGTVWIMDQAYATDIDGFGIRRLRRTCGLIDESKRIPIDQVELLMDVGLGTATGPGSDPQVTMRLSQDGGRTFGNEHRSGLGRIGEYRKRVFWTRLGASPDAVLEFVWADPSPIFVVDAYLNNLERARAA